MGLFRRQKKRDGRPKAAANDLTGLQATELPSGWRIAGHGAAGHGAAYRQGELRLVLASASSTSPADLGGAAQFADEDAEALGWFTAVLVPEPNNEFDPNAVAIYSAGGPRVGYVPASHASEFTEVITTLINPRGSVGATCPAFVRNAREGAAGLALMLCCDMPNWILENGLEPDEDDDELDD